MAEIRAKLIMDTSQAESKINSLKSKIKKQERLILDIQTKEEKLNSLKNKINLIKNELKSLSQSSVNVQQWEKYKKELDLVNASIHKVQNQMKAMKSAGQVDTTQFNNFKRQLESLKQYKDILQDNIKVLVDTSDVQRAITLQKQLKTTEGQAIRSEIDIKNIEQEHGKVDDLKRDLNEFRGELYESEVSVRGFEQIKSNIRNAQASIKNFGAGIENVGKKMWSAFSINSNNPIGKFAHFLTKGIGYSAVYRGVTAGMNAMNEALSGSIERFDAIRRGTNVLKNLRDSEGLAFDDSQINRLINGVHKAGEEYDGLADRILGLPTTLDEAVSHTTDLVSVTKDLDYSADLYTAMNDAVLSFGGNSENVQRVMNQFIVALGKGKVDGRAFRAMLQNHMTPALNEVAKSLGKANAGELQEALSKGEISARQFSDALIDLDKNGSEGMNALRETVFDSVDTISGSMQVLKARLTAGFTDVFTALNETIGEIFGDDRNLIYWIKQLGTNFRESMQGIANSVREHKDEIQQGIDFIANKFKDFWDTIKQFNFQSFLQGIADFKPVFMLIKSIIQEVFETIKSVMEFIGGGDVSRGLGRFVTGWYLFAGALMGAGKALQAISGPLGIVIGLMQSMGKLGALKKGGLLAGLFKGFKPQIEGEGAEGVAGAFGTEQMVAGLKKTVVNLARVGALALEIAVISKSIKYAYDQIPKDFGGLAGKFTALAGVVAEMELLTQAVGHFATKAPAEQLFGTLSMIFEGGALVSLAKGIGELDKALPDNVGTDFVKKMGALAGVVTELSVLGGIIGALEVGTGGLGAIAGALGLGTLAGIGETLKVLGEGMQELNKADLDAKNISHQMNALEQIITSVGGLTLDSFKTDAEGFKGVKKAFNALKSVANSVQSIAGVSYDIDQAQVNVESLSSIIKTLTDNLAIKEGEAISYTAVENAQKAVESMKKLPQGLRDFSVEMQEVTKEISATKIGNQAKKISEVIGTITANMQISGFKDFVDNEMVVNVNNALTSLKTTVDELLNFGDKFSDNAFSATRIKGHVEQLTKALSAFKDNELSAKIDYMTQWAGKLTTVQTQLSNLKSIVTSLNDFVTTMTSGGRDFLSKDIVEQATSRLRGALEAINGIIGTDSPMTTMTQGVAKGDFNFATVSQQLTELQNIVTAINNIAVSQIDTAKIQTVANNIRTAIQSLKTAFGGGGNGQAIGGAVGVSAVNGIQQMVSAIQNAINTLNSLDFTATGTNYGQQIIDGFNSIDIPGAFGGAIDKAKGVLEGKASIFTSVGKTYATNLKNGFNSSLTGLGSGIIAQALSMVMTGSGAFRSAGVLLGNALLNGIQSSLNQGVTVQVTASTHASGGGLIDGVSRFLNNIKANMSLAGAMLGQYANGGSIGYYAKGGMLAYFEPKGSDTVPAMLTPGEFVIQRKAVKAYGADFFKHLNHMDTQKAFQSLVNKDMSMQTSAMSYTTINNNNSVYNDNRSVSVNGGNERSQRLKAGRFLRGLV